MTMPATPLLDIDDREDYAAESNDLLLAAEARLAEWQQGDLCEAERAVAEEIVEAMRRIHGLLQNHRTRSMRVSVAGAAPEGIRPGHPSGSLLERALRRRRLLPFGQARPGPPAHPPLRPRRWWPILRRDRVHGGPHES
jgi:hypothetical protein